MKDSVAAKDEITTIIEPKSGWQIIDFQELKDYRDLIFFLIWRDIKVLYAQTILGFLWAILQPLVQIVIFTIVFGKVAKVSSEGIPYVLFSCVAIIPWNYMAQAVQRSSESLVQGQYLLGKIYFPRILFPLTPIFAKLVDFFISMVIVAGVCLYYNVLPTLQIVYIPFLILYMISISSGIGMWLSAMAIRFRDVRFATPFAIQMLMYSAPIVYSANSLPENLRFIYSFNPIVGVIEGFRASVLGTNMPWEYIWPGLLVAAIIFISGGLYFKRMERVFVDVI